MQSNATHPHPAKKLGLQVHLADQEGVNWHGQVTDISHGHVVFTFLGDDLPCFGMLDEVVMAFTSTMCRSIPAVQGIVLSRAEEGNTRTYRCVLEGLEDLLEEIPEPLRHLFTGRSATRTRLDPDKQVEVRLQAPDGTSVEAQGVDLSTVGICLSIKAALDVHFSAADGVLAHIHFLDEGGGTLLVSMPGVIRRRWIVDGALHYGIQFADKDQPLCEVGLSTIEEYVHIHGHLDSTDTEAGA